MSSSLDPALLDAVWDGADDQRRRTADLLERLAPERWDTPSLCPGWTVRDVAAHLTMQQQGYGDVARFLARNPRALTALGLNAFIRTSAVLQARRLGRAETVARIRGSVGSRRHNAFVTPLETLTDVLVHSQDIAVPLGLELAMDPAASTLAAERRWTTRHDRLSRVFRPVPLDGVRLVATDSGWARGEGPEVRGPAGALLLLLTGREAGLRHLSGDGAELLRRTPAPSGRGPAG